MSASAEAPVSARLMVRDLGLMPYDQAWALQRDTAQRRIAGQEPHDVLLLVEHPPVVTLGRSTKPGHLLASPQVLEADGVELREVERGGDVTVHEPGQLVAYPIIDLKQHRKDLHWYLRQVEEAIVLGLRDLGLETGRVPGLTGVWIHDAQSGQSRKLASIGVHARDWVTWHGVALNVENTLATFRHTVPCGIDGVEMTTVHRECVRLGLPVPSMGAVRQAIVGGFAQAFQLTPVPQAAE